METSKYLRILKDEIHSTVFATIDENKRPVTCVIDVMLVDEKGIYFLTAKGKSFYKRLKLQPFVSLTGMKGENTMSSKSITLSGEVREIGTARLAEIFSMNPYMAEIYPDITSRSALTVFQIYRGSGEFFDLSCRPIFREKFSFGGGEIHEGGYYINDRCIGCNLCHKHCPQKCIDLSVYPVKIRQKHCLHCGKCMEVCPEGAVERR